ncbi:MAG: MalY/PatB family protein [Anaerolineae bacterium]
MANPFDRVPDRRDPNLLNKWTWYPNDVIPMWVADMDFRAPPAVLSALKKAVEHGVLGYELPSKALLETVARRMDRLYGWKVDPDSIVTVTGIVSGFHVAGRAFCTERQSYLIQPPVYNEFHSLKTSLGLEQLEAPLLETIKGNILHYEVNWEAFEQQARKAGMFLLCNPHNPLGLIYSRRDLRRMADICMQHGVLIVADEIHSELLLGDEKFLPMAKLSSEVARNTVTLVSPSKTFNVPGLFCGFAIIPNPDLRAKYAGVVEHLRMHTSSFGLLAARAAFSGECDDWLKDLRAYLTANRDYVIDYVDQYLPDVRVTRPAGTYLAWLDFRPLVEQRRITGSPFDFFINEAKVALSDGKIFAEEYAEYVRLNFGTTRRTLKQGLDRMRDAIYRRNNG